MAPIRCPMCGRPNPEELDQCQFCQTPLKPKRPTGTGPGGPDDRPGTKQLQLPEDEGLDWLRSLHSNQVGPGAVSANPFIEDPSGAGFSDGAEPGEIPDWLEAIRRRTAEDGLQGKPGLGVPDLSKRSPFSNPTEDPAWLTDFRTAQETPGLETFEPLEPLPASPMGSPELPVLPELPTDWISQLTASEPTDQKTPQWNPDEQFSPDFGATFHSEELPDWLKDISDAANFTSDLDDGPRDMSAELSMMLGGDAGASAAEPPILATPEDELPDWVRAFRAQRDAEKSQPPEISSRGLETAKLTWPEDESPAVPPQKAQAAQPAEEVPAWLSSLEERSNLKADASFPPQEPARPMEDFATGEKAELPDWLGDAQPAGGFAGTPIELNAAGEETLEEEPLAPAELPSWIQAMRPVETIAPLPATPPVEEDAHIEMSGPLAGLQGTLTVEQSAMPVIHPSVYSPWMQVTEKQKLHGELLEELLSSETKPQDIPAEPLISSQRVMRILIAVILIAAIVAPLIGGIQILPVPAAGSAEVLAVQQSVAGLQPGAPILLAVDYSPALAGEMEAAALGLVDDLMAHSARLTLISTTPSGPALANRLVTRVFENPQSYQAGYASGDMTIHLGYLAGGASGLAGFAKSPLTAAPFTLDGQYAWEQPALAGVTGINGFARIIVLTDSLETGQAWIEQLQPTLGGGSSGSLLFVTSAQAAPLLRPYVQSGQVSGMISGLAGGAVYESLTGRPGPGSTMWNGFQGGLWASILIITVGALVYGVLALVRSNHHKSEAAV